jgi:hypothetical protein
MPNSASTELEAINLMLSTIGETPVNSLSGVLPADVAMARNSLAAIVREIQLMGWHFNTEEDYPLPLGPNGEITVPPNVAAAFPPEGDLGLDVLVRGNRLYDRANHTYTFTEPVSLTVKLLLPFDSLPEAFKWYATVRAAMKFQDQVVGSDGLHNFTADDEARARVMAEREDMLYARPSLARGQAATFLDGWNVGQTLERD